MISLAITKGTFEHLGCVAITDEGAITTGWKIIIALFKRHHNLHQACIITSSI